MTPLQTFLDTAKKLAVKPVDFWPTSQKKETLANLTSAITKLKKILENKKLTATHAYAKLKALEKTVSLTDLKEVNFIQCLSNLVDIYKHAPADDATLELINELESALCKAKPRVLEYHLSLEHLEKKAKKLTAEAKEKSDLETLQKVGVFYVLEYTLQVLFEFSRLSDQDKAKLLKSGLKTKAGNLPAYFSLEDTMRKELCYKIFDDNLRDKLLNVFYDFESVCHSEDMLVFAKALKKFNIDLLSAFNNYGFTTFKAVIYAPYGNNILITNLIKHL